MRQGDDPEGDAIKRVVVLVGASEDGDAPLRLLEDSPWLPRRPSPLRRVGPVRTPELLPVALTPYRSPFAYTRGPAPRPTPRERSTLLRCRTDNAEPLAGGLRVMAGGSESQDRRKGQRQVVALDDRRIAGEPSLLREYPAAQILHRARTTFTIAHTIY